MFMFSSTVSVHNWIILLQRHKPVHAYLIVGNCINTHREFEEHEGKDENASTVSYEKQRLITSNKIRKYLK